MVSWKRAFKAAGLRLLYGILWSLLGLILVFIGLSLAIGSVRWGVYGFELNTGAALSGLAAAVVGFVIFNLSMLASVYKMGGGLIVDEVRVRSGSRSRLAGIGVHCPSWAS